MAFDLADDYVDVAERIREFRDKYPDGSLQQVKVDMINFADRSWVVYTAAAYRSPDDQRPGMGTAWEPVPGKTPFTRDSELQNAETAAWGRAIVAALAADTKKIATADEIRNRQEDRHPEGRPLPPVPDRAQAWARVWEASRKIDPLLNDSERQLYLRGELKAHDLDGSQTTDLIKLGAILEAAMPV